MRHLQHMCAHRLARHQAFVNAVVVPVIEVEADLEVDLGVVVPDGA